jgi:hypothetical protein
MTGTLPNILLSLISKRPFFNEYISLLMSNRSEQDFTGRKRERGTLMPWALLKCLMAPPAAVSSC